MSTETQSLRHMTGMELSTLEKAVAEERWRRSNNLDTDKPDPRVSMRERLSEPSETARIENASGYAGTAGNESVGLGELTLENVENAFTYHPWDTDRAERGAQVREALVIAAKTILRACRRSPLRTRALNLIFDARMVANAAITHGGRF